MTKRAIRPVGKSQDISNLVAHQRVAASSAPVFSPGEYCNYRESDIPQQISTLMLLSEGAESQHLPGEQALECIRCLFSASCE